MFGMFRHMFMALSQFFIGFEKIGNSFVNLTTIGEEMSGTYLDETRAQRADQRLQLEAKTKALRLKQAQAEAATVIDAE